MPGSSGGSSPATWPRGIGPTRWWWAISTRRGPRRLADEHGFDGADVDVLDPDSLDAFLTGASVVVNAAQYHVNLAVMEGALRAGCHYLDLGGLFHTTRRQLELGERFEEAGLSAVLGIGSCPGIANVHAGDLGSRLDQVRSVRIFNGATIDPSDRITWPYSLWTILDEVTERPVVFRGGRVRRGGAACPKRSRFPFLEPIGHATTHLSLHSEVATIPVSLAAKGIERCEFKIRFFGLSEPALRKLAFLASIGLASTEPRTVGEARGVIPRRLLVDLLEETAPPPPEHAGFKDIATVAEGTKDGVATRLRLDATAWPSPELGVGGGTVAVAAPPAVVARWLAGDALTPPASTPRRP